MATTATTYEELLKENEELKAQIQTTQQNQTQYQTPTRPENYVSPYAQELESLAGELKNSTFDYNQQEDPNWQAMRKEYLLASQRTEKDVLSQASAATGGRASSYAVTAASQAANDLRASFTQEEAAIYDQAYARYYQDYSKKLQDYENLLNQDEMNYGRWMTEQQQAQEARDKAYDDLVTLIATTGHTPSQAQLEAAGMSESVAASWRNYYQTQLALSQSSGSGGGGASYNSWVAEQQQMLNDEYGAGLKVDGIWGSKTEAAYNKYVVNGASAKTYNNGMTAEQISLAAQNYYLQNPSVRLDSRTLDGWLANNGYSGESSTAFKAYLQALGATYSGQH